MVRSDIPPIQQAVQAAHATLEAGFRFGRPNDCCNLVLLAADDEGHLLVLRKRIEVAGIAVEAFYEPDDKMGWSAFASRPVFGSERRAFRGLRPLVIADPSRAPPSNLRPTLISHEFEDAPQARGSTS